MAVITISRQLGSMGCEVAQSVAKLLGYRVAWRDAINKAARRAGVPDVALHTIDELGLLGLHPTLAEQNAYKQALEQVLLEFADEGNYVIVGRAGQVILRNRADVIHVRIIAPKQVRIERVMQKQSITAEAAKAQVEVSDRARRSFLHRSYQADWDDPGLYDLVINTERISPHSSAVLVCSLMNQKISECSEPLSPDASID